jgi:hypothetical protein
VWCALHDPVRPRRGDACLDETVMQVPGESDW